MTPSLIAVSESDTKLHLYVYYRTGTNHTAAVTAGVTQLQKVLRDSLGVQCVLLQRPERTDGKITWMECYQGISPGFSDALEAALAATDFTAFIEGERHCEYFQECLAFN